MNKIILISIIKKLKEMFYVVQIGKHRGYLMEKARLTPEDFDLLLTLIMERVTLVGVEDFAGSYPAAFSIMEKTDPDDAPFLAVGICALA
jgi:predicted nucleic acid-binding protein